MKILHTADLHLGKNLYETSQYERQKKMLDDIHKILLKDDYAALIIAGDIYDRSIPPAEYVALFDSFLSAVHQDCPDTTVFIIPGNHDSAERLAFGSKILSSGNIHIAADIGKLCSPIIIAQNGEKVQFFLMPFLHLSSFSKENSELKLTSQSEMAQEASRRLKEAVDPSIPSVLVAHLFTLNGESSSSERSFLGTAEYVSPALFDFFTYTAIGHLHKMQKITGRMYYSGAPLTYAFDECSTEKVVLSVDIDCKTQGFPVRVEKIPIIPLRKMSRLEGSFFDFFNTDKFDAYKDDFLEIKLTGSTLIQSPMSLLQQKFPYLLNLHQEAVAAELKEEEQIHILKKNIEDEDVIFENFMLFEKAIDEEPSAKKQELFKSLCKEQFT
ncbi:exonuclease SbcCD subunit D [Treponema putidum]|uniref:Nuclease SbcCD subunit D n=1 Tax=Treponema putidum TaxID=221027 RepID=A0AAE9SI20_9SPIR|nr:exonuclease subunit SbcD [Treponema putidum]AIN93444.1 metallophosphatase [Treponema putidum]TWI73105.1 exodeoxyribonuclease I subunit D [Treponema putidum]UTY29689.1 exonuclease subunit SbcD [Treponema putidum]UTY32159.1 exonuclease subunit SbcD [Treponema putidum]UTY34548.1 exonuclease subunit SbcD [Treponema putidum]